MNRTDWKVGIAGAAALMLAACGGGGGGGGGGDDSSSGPTFEGSTSSATLSTSNSEDLSRAGAEGVRKAKAQDSAPAITGVVTETDDAAWSLVEETTRDIVTGASGGVVSAATTSVNGDCGGTADLTFDDSQSSTPENGSITYNDFCITDGDGGQVTVNGTIDFTFTYNNSNELTRAVYTYSNVTVNLPDGSTQTLNATIDCDFSASTLSGCTISEDFTGLNGTTYRVENVSVSGDAGSGYDVSATVYHPDHGSVSITTTQTLFFECANGQPSAGQIEITDGTNTAVIDFVDCTSFTVTFDGSTVSYNW